MFAYLNKRKYTYFGAAPTLCGARPTDRCGIQFHHRLTVLLNTFTDYRILHSIVCAVIQDRSSCSDKHKVDMPPWSETIRQMAEHHFCSGSLLVGNKVPAVTELTELSKKFLNSLLEPRLDSMWT